IYITTFVYWVGIAHSGTLLSSILYLFRARWRQSIYRAAEAMTVFAVATAGLFPIIHLGRPWVFYWLLPYPNQRWIWPDFRSPLVWDVFAVITYLTVSALFFYTGLIPDIAAARDATTVGWRKRLYTILAVGWRGKSSQWKHFTRGYLYMAALATSLVVVVSSVVSWDFAMALVPGWHSTVFAPYFVGGAIFSGVAMVIALMVPVRRVFHLESYLTLRHFDGLAKLLLLMSFVVTYSYAAEVFMAWYSGVPAEVQGNYVMGSIQTQYWWATAIMLTCNVLVPQALWFKRIRRSIPALFVMSILVNIGMWFERFVIIVTSLSKEFEPWQWGTYKPSWVEMGILAGSFGWFLMFFLIFLRVLPPVAVAELKEVLPAPLRFRKRPVVETGRADRLLPADGLEPEAEG
ncbi:MAG: polysulfide reductase NrfD, partial [Gemmatimonadota bacterium]